jgi:hypothetical protein
MEPSESVFYARESDVNGDADTFLVCRGPKPFEGWVPLMRLADTLVCDVMVVPATLLRKGCKVSTLLQTIEQRRTWNEVPSFPSARHGTNLIICDHHKNGRFEPCDECAKERQ